MKAKAPQFELPTIGTEVFNLRLEAAVDGERVQREIDQARHRLWETKQQERKQQPDLI
jgi:hypothetical protein